MAEEKKTQQQGAGTGADVTAKPAKAKKRTVKVDAVGEAHINASFNNINVTLTIHI